jgi:hypothetical protein
MSGRDFPANDPPRCDPVRILRLRPVFPAIAPHSGSARRWVNDNVQGGVQVQVQVNVDVRGRSPR